MTELEDAVAQLDDWIGDALATLGDGLPADQSALTTLAYYFRLRGIAGYLASMDEAFLVGMLHRAGQARLHYLEGCAAGSTGDQKFATTPRNVPFLDALAIHDLATAARLAALCDGKWNPEIQYEDDFLWMQFVQSALIAPDREPVLLRRFEEVTEGESPFFLLCSALHARDAAAFDAHLRAILKLRAANFEAMRDPQDLPIAILATEPYLDVQGLALLRLAASRGIAVAPEYPAIPAPLVAMPPGRHPFPAANAWRSPAM